MITWSKFVRYMNEERHAIPRATYNAIVQEALERRHLALSGTFNGRPPGYADLVERAENAIAPK